jgi:predicted Fe-Mo cluster-binding NifX family protein
VRVVVTANGTDLDAPASPVFGRCPTYVFVDTESMQTEAVDNPAVDAARGAGIQAAQLVVEQGAQAVLTGNIGPNALDVFQAAGIPVYLCTAGTVREAVEAFQGGGLPSIAEASTRAGMGMGMGRGMGRGMGMRRGGGMGRAAVEPPMPPVPPGPSSTSHEDEVASLKEMAGSLRKQLADILERLDRLEKEE